MNKLIKETKEFMKEEFDKSKTIEEFKKKFYSLEEKFKNSKDFIFKDFQHTKINSYWLVDNDSIRPLYEVSFYESERKDLYSITLESRENNLSMCVKKFNL